MTDKQVSRLQDHARDMHGIAQAKLCIEDLLEEFGVKEMQEIKEEEMEAVFSFILWWGRDHLKKKIDGRKRKNDGLFRIGK